MKKYRIKVFYPLMILAFIISAFSLLHYRTTHIKAVVVHDETLNYYIQSYDKTVRDVVERCEIILNENDLIEPGLDEELSDEMEINISRSYELIIRDGLEKQTVFTTKHTVREILEENQIQINPLDIVAPFIDAKISSGTHITITRVWDEIVTENVVVPYLTKINLVSDLEDSKIELVQSGENGLKEVEYRVRYENGEKVSKSFETERIVIDPVSEIKNKGTDNLFVTSRGLPFRYSETLICEATAYDLSYASCGKLPDHPAYGITYTGTQARPGVIAVDPRVIPLGSKVYVQSLDGTRDYGFAIAEDTGSAIKGQKIDLFIGNNAAALRYGRRNVRVYIIEDPVDDEYIKGYGY